MGILAIVSLVLAAIVGILTESGMGFLIAFGFCFISGLPRALAMDFIHGEVEYLADRADARQEESDMFREDYQVYNDNRSVRFYGKSYLENDYDD